MKRLFGKSLALLLAVLCTVMLLVPALAADEETVITIDVTISASGGVPESGETTYVTVTPQRDDAPMPEGTENGVYTLPLTISVDEETGEATASGQFQIEVSAYPEAGTYTYEIKQTGGSVSGASYDTSVYTLTVTIDVTANGSKQATVTLTNDEDDGDKRVAAAFANVYPTTPTPSESPESPSPSTTGEDYDDPAPEPDIPTPDDTPDENPTTPDETPEENPTTIEEEDVPLDDGETPAEEPETVTIEDEEVPQGDVTIEDEDVPEGGVTIEDEPVPQGSLPQTGQLWWPVLLMFVLGLALLGAAAFDLHQTKRNSERS